MTIEQIRAESKAFDEWAMTANPVYISLKKIDDGEILIYLSPNVELMFQCWLAARKYVPKAINNNNKFKFGDKVIVKNEVNVNGVVVDVIETDSGQDIVQVYEIHQDEELEMEFTVVNDRKPEELELTPHPDTIQLNALKEKISKISNVSFSCNLCGEDNEISAEIQDIIDFAISEEQADD